MEDSETYDVAFAPWYVPPGWEQLASVLKSQLYYLKFRGQNGAEDIELLVRSVTTLAPSCLEVTGFNRADEELKLHVTYRHAASVSSRRSEAILIEPTSVEDQEKADTLEELGKFLTTEQAADVLKLVERCREDAATVDPSLFISAIS